MNEYYQQISSYFNENQSVIAVYHHGSRSKGVFREDSDFDIALLLNYDISLTSLEILTIGSELESIMPFQFDISIINTENLILAKEVIVNGKCVLCNDRMAKEYFEMMVFSMYARLQYDRREVLNEYTIR